MGILDRLFGGRSRPRPDRATTWSRRPGLELECDLSTPSLAGIRLGDPVEALARLGAPDGPQSLDTGQFTYANDGFEIDADQGRVDALCMWWRWEDTPKFRGFQPFSGTFRHAGKPIALGPATDERACVALFGEPYWRDEDVDEVLLFYEFGEVEWQLEFMRAQGTLAALIIVTPPLLSSPEQRAMYRVDRPWPPDRASAD